MKYLILLMLAMIVVGCDKPIHEARAPIANPAAALER